MELFYLVRIAESRDRCLAGSFWGVPLSSLKRDAKMKTKDLKQSNAKRSQKCFHRSRRRHDPMLVFNISVFNSLPEREKCLVMKRTTLLAFILSSGGGRETFGFCIVPQTNLKPGSVMPAGYIEPRKIVFHRQRVPHQTCDMNWRQELVGDSQILPRNPSRPSARSKNFLQPQQ